MIRNNFDQTSFGRADDDIGQLLATNEDEQDLILCEGFDAFEEGNHHCPYDAKDWRSGAWWEGHNAAHDCLAA